MKKLLLFALHLLCLNLLAQNTMPLRRVAYVVGNADYDVGKLYNPVNDARDLAENLKKLGFEVHKFENVKLAEFRSLVNQYGAELSSDPKRTVGLFYYSGHGLQVNGKNFLVPIDDKKRPRDAEELEIHCFNVGSLMTELHVAKNLMNIVILDACRANPFEDDDNMDSKEKSRVGLAAVEAPVGTFVAFATSPGNVAADGDGLNGLYTQELIKSMQLPDMPIEQVFKKVRTHVKELSGGRQIPWENSSLEEEFFFKKSSEPLQEGKITSSTTEDLPMPERYARDVCNCLNGLTLAMEKIEKAPQNTPMHKLERLEYEAKVAISQGEQCTKNMLRNYNKMPTKEDEAQAKEILKKLCPSVYTFLNK
jgi:Caspase domain